VTRSLARSSSSRLPLAGVVAFASLVGTALLTTEASAISRTAIVARAQEWVDAKLLYCVSTKGAYDSTCGYTCNRQDNPAWNPYFSDCSGLITWAWGLSPAQRLYTGSIAPYGGNQSFQIDPHDLQPGDALNDRTTTNGKLHHHVMLFGGWKIPGKVAILLQESGCNKVANRSEQNVQFVGDKLQVGSHTYFAVRFKDVAAAENCQAHCEGSKIFNADCSSGDCGVYGATCLAEASGPRCVYQQCPPTGTAPACIDDKHIAKCVNGLPTEVGDCSAYAAFCSNIDGPHCASAFCAEPGVKPVAHTSCFIDGSILQCDDKGGQTTSPCPANTKCSVFPTPHCEANTGCPATGDVRMCLDGRAVRCYEGTLAEAIDCVGQGRGCEVVNGLASCTEETSGDGEDPTAAGAPGSAGSPGAAGMGGGSGDAGAAGDAAAAGNEATGGTAPGTGGATESGGKSGSSATSGAAGQPGGAGFGNKGGSLSSDPNAAGNAGAAGRRGPVYTTAEEDSGCSVSPTGSSLFGAWLLAISALAATRRRRG
jgi:hypothetical protein